MREIWEERLVTVDGHAPPPTLVQHKATIFSRADDGGSVEVWLSSTLEDLGYLKLTDPDDDGEVSFAPSDLIAALADLRRIGPFNAELSSDDSQIQERAAKAVERVCEELAKSGDPYHDTLAVDLRTAMLALIERATRVPSDA